MKKSSFRCMAHLVAGLALTVAVSQSALANGGCPGGGGGARPPIAPPPSVAPGKPPAPPSTFIPGQSAGSSGASGANFNKVPPPPSSTPGLTAAQKEKLEADKYALNTQYLANIGKVNELKDKNRTLDAEIRKLENQMREAETVRPKEYSRLELQLMAAKQDRNNNSNAIREYTNRSQENLRKIDIINGKLGKK